jgi:hypothetical protein
MRLAIIRFKMLSTLIIELTNSIIPITKSKNDWVYWNEIWKLDGTKDHLHHVHPISILNDTRISYRIKPINKVMLNLLLQLIPGREVLHREDHLQRLNIEDIQVINLWFLNMLNTLLDAVQINWRLLRTLIPHKHLIPMEVLDTVDRPKHRPYPLNVVPLLDHLPMVTTPDPKWVNLLIKDIHDMRKCLTDHPISHQPNKVTFPPANMKENSVQAV